MVIFHLLIVSVLLVVIIGILLHNVQKLIINLIGKRFCLLILMINIKKERSIIEGLNDQKMLIQSL